MRVLGLGLCVVLLVGCRDGAFGQASKSDSIAGYREFLRANPADPNAEAAKERLAELELAEAERIHTVIGYKRFLEAFPDGDEAQRARAHLETLRFNAALGRKTGLALRQFLKEHRDGAHRAEAEAALARLELAELGASDDPSVVSALAARHADRAEVATDASERLDELAWAKASSPAALFAYLREYPAGGHRDEARARLLGLELDGLVVSEDLAQARAVAQKSPLQAAVPGLKARLERAELVARLLTSRDDRIRRALPAYTLRPLEELLRALGAPDSLDRWQAAEELGYHVSVKALSPLLETFRTARLSLVRQRAADAVARVLQALPRPVAEHEVASRLEALGGQASEAQLLLTSALLLDLSGQLERSSREYQKAWDPAAPDPVILRRWAAIRLERGQFFSAAVAARQLALHGLAASGDAPSASEANARAAARALCSAAEEVRFAEGVLEQVARQPTEFPEDVSAFVARAREARRLVDARLHDAELRLLTEDASAKSCADASVSERVAAGQAMRLSALAELEARPPPQWPLLLEVVRERDPSTAVRERAGASAQKR